MCDRAEYNRYIGHVINRVICRQYLQSLELWEELLNTRCMSNAFVIWNVKNVYAHVGVNV